MEINDYFLVSKDCRLNNGLIPNGAILVIKDINRVNNEYLITIKPFIKNNERTMETFTVIEDFIIQNSTPITQK